MFNVYKYHKTFEIGMVVILQYLQKNILPLEKMSAFDSDGAAAMVGRKS